jgi:hypothetical protein
MSRGSSEPTSVGIGLGSGAGVVDPGALPPPKSWRSRGSSELTSVGIGLGCAVGDPSGFPVSSPIKSCAICISLPRRGL